MTHGVQAHGAELNSEAVDFDAPAQKGWAFFTKFAFWTALAVIAGLLFIGWLTMWS
jgi:hypothetical protein